MSFAAFAEAAPSIVGALGGGGSKSAPPAPFNDGDYITQGGLTINPSAGKSLFGDVDLDNPQHAAIAAGTVVIFGMVALSLVRRLER